MRVIKYYKHSDYYGFRKELSYYFCQIEFIFDKYNSYSMINLLGKLSKEINIENEPKNIIRIQNSIVKPINDEIWIHRRALSTLFQIYCSIKQNWDDTTLYDFQGTDILELFLCTNDILELSEERLLQEINDPVERSIFVSFKWIGDLITASDIQANILFFKKYYGRISISDKAEVYESIFINEMGIEFSKYLDILNNVSFKKTSKDDYNQISNLLSLNIEEIFERWESREPKLKIPFEYKFIETYPLIKFNDELFVGGIHLLFIGLIRRAYHCLSGSDKGKKFRDFFGIKIVEPTIKEYLSEILIDNETKELNVSKDGYEYADFGVINGNSILLFEIKSTMMGLNLRYESTPQTFFEEFDRRYASKESGAGQQVERLLDINKDFESFCKLTGLSINQKYSVYNILLVFDDTLAAEGSNFYIRIKYEAFISEDYKAITKIHTPIRNSLLTFNELYTLNKELKSSQDRIQFLIEYNKNDLSFNSFLGQKGMLI